MSVLSTTPGEYAVHFRADQRGLSGFYGEGGNLLAVIRETAKGVAVHEDDYCHCKALDQKGRIVFVRVVECLATVAELEAAGWWRNNWGWVDVNKHLIERGYSVRARGTSGDWEMKGADGGWYKFYPVRIGQAVYRDAGGNRVVIKLLE